MGLIVTLVILALIVFWAVGMYNNLVNSRNRVRNAFSQIDVQLTRRYDLIPNLVETVKGYMTYEKSTLEAVINARNAAQAGLKKAAADPSDPEAMTAGCFCTTRRGRWWTSGSSRTAWPRWPSTTRPGSRYPRPTPWWSPRTA